MVERNVNIDYKQNPVLLDKVLQDIQITLKDKLAWLDMAFGRAYKLVEHDSSGDKFVYPAAYVGNSEYVSLLPNDNFGNFSWFDIYDPQNIYPVMQSLPQISFTGAIVFWYNLNSIYADSKFVYSEEIKDDILRVLTAPGIIKHSGSKLEISEIYERFENIYKGYSLEKVYNSNVYNGQGIQNIDKQYFMHPYSGIRIEFKLITRELCQRYIR